MPGNERYVAEEQDYALHAAYSCLMPGGALAIADETRRAAFECLHRIVLNRKVRLLSVRLGGLEPSGRSAR